MWDQVEPSPVTLASEILITEMTTFLVHLSASGQPAGEVQDVNDLLNGSATVPIVDLSWFIQVLGTKKNDKGKITIKLLWMLQIHAVTKAVASSFLTSWATEPNKTQAETPSSVHFSAHCFMVNLCARTCLGLQKPARAVVEVVA